MDKRGVRNVQCILCHGVERTDSASQLERFAALLKDGLITREEYDRKKTEILESGDTPPG